MTDLLKRWSRLEPSRCLIAPPTGLICAGVRTGDAWHNVLWHEPSDVQIAILLAAVIEAIEARGWDYRLAWRMAPTGEHFGVIKIDREDGWSKSWSCYAGSPAAALLGAYLAALEAEAEA